MEITGAGNGDDRLEHEHEVVELGAPFAQVFGPEIVDANLTDLEFRLLVYLRITAGRNGSTWITHKQIAKHLGKGERSIKRAYSELLAKGFAKSRKRNYGQSSKKILTAPSKIYEADRMCRFFSYLRTDATDEDIAFLRRDTLDSSDKSNSAKSGTTDDLDNSQPSNSAESGTINSAESGTSIGPDLSTSRSRSHESDHKEVDHTSEVPPRKSKTDLLLEEDLDSPEEKPKQTKGDQYRARFKANPLGEESKTTSDEERLAGLQAAVATGEASEPQRIRTSRQKGADRREAKRVADASPDGPRPSAKTTAKLRGKGGMNAKDVKQHYFEKTSDCFAGEPVGRWGVKELAHAKALLDDYGWDLVETVITELCENWSGYSERMKNTGLYPTIAWMYGCRQQLFSEIQKKRKMTAKPAASGKPKRKKKHGELLGE
jgi:hypothetical protein